MSKIAYDPTLLALNHPENMPTLFTSSAPANLEALCTEAARLAYIRFEESDGEFLRLKQSLATAGYTSVTPLIDTATDGAGYGAIQVLNDQIEAREEYVENHTLLSGVDVPVRDLADHSPINYCRAYWG
jgi:hypothetical protein